MDQVLVYWSMQPILVEEFYDRDQSYDNLFHLGIRNYVFHFKKKKKKSKFPLISFAVISNFPWKLRNPFYYKAQTRQIPSLIKPSMSVCGRAAKYVPNHLRLKTLSLKKNREEKQPNFVKTFYKVFTTYNEQALLSTQADSSTICLVGIFSSPLPVSASWAL